MDCVKLVEYGRHALEGAITKKQILLQNGQEVFMAEGDDPVLILRSGVVKYKGCKLLRNVKMHVLGIDIWTIYVLLGSSQGSLNGCEIG